MFNSNEYFRGLKAVFEKLNTNPIPNAKFIISDKPIPHIHKGRTNSPNSIIRNQDVRGQKNTFLFI